MRERAEPYGAGFGLRLLAAAAVTGLVGCSQPPPNPTATVSDIQVEIATNPETGNPMGRRITGSVQLADPGHAGHERAASARRSADLARRDPIAAYL